MESNFYKSLEAVLKHEGGYVDHPRDPGGATNKGITNKTYQGWRRSIGFPPRHVKYIREAEVQSIYRNNYWHHIQGDELPSGLDYAVFDGAVNSGPSRSVKWLQKALRVNVDGRLGPHTLKTARDLSDEDVVRTIREMLNYRMGFLKRLHHWSTFGRGWTNRVNGVRKLALEMADQPDDVMPEPDQTEVPGFWKLLTDLLEQIFGRK